MRAVRWKGMRIKYRRYERRRADPKTRPSPYVSAQAEDARLSPLHLRLVRVDRRAVGLALALRDRAAVTGRSAIAGGGFHRADGVLHVLLQRERIDLDGVCPGGLGAREGLGLVGRDD